MTQTFDLGFQEGILAALTGNDDLIVLNDSSEILRQLLILET